MFRCLPAVTGPSRTLLQLGPRNPARSSFHGLRLRGHLTSSLGARPQRLSISRCPCAVPTTGARSAVSLAASCAISRAPRTARPIACLGGPHRSAISTLTSKAPSGIPADMAQAVGSAPAPSSPAVKEVRHVLLAAVPPSSSERIITHPPNHTSGVTSGAVGRGGRGVAVRGVLRGARAHQGGGPRGQRQRQRLGRRASHPARPLDHGAQLLGTAGHSRSTSRSLVLQTATCTSKLRNGCAQAGWVVQAQERRVASRRFLCHAPRRHDGAPRARRPPSRSATSPPTRSASSPCRRCCRPAPPTPPRRCPPSRPSSCSPPPPPQVPGPGPRSSLDTQATDEQQAAQSRDREVPCGRANARRRTPW